MTPEPATTSSGGGLHNRASLISVYDTDDDDATLLDFNGESRRGVPSGEPLPWYITTRKIFVRRGVGERLGMVVCSDFGRYGTRVDKVHPDSAADAAGVKPDDIFIRIGEEHVLHCDHEKLVGKLATLPPCFVMEVAENFQMPTAFGKYVITVREPRGMVGVPLPGASIGRPRRSSPSLLPRAPNSPYL
jgi:hypothetical protein